MQDAAPMIDLSAEMAGVGAAGEAVPIPPAVEIGADATDEALMTAFAEGRTEAFTTLFERYKQPVFGFFRRRVVDPAQAEELAQETFMAVLRSASRYEQTALFRTWIYAIAFRILRTHRRKWAFQATFFGAAEKAREPAAAGCVDVDLMMRQAVGRLDALDREVLLLREFEQLSYAEIAELLNVPLNTVRSRLFRARTALHDLLAARAATRSVARKERL